MLKHLTLNIFSKFYGDIHFGYLDAKQKHLKVRGQSEAALQIGMYD